MIDRKALAKRIKDVRGERTLKEFAELVGVSHTSIRRYEEGAMPDIDILLKIAEVAGMDLGRLITGKPLPADVRDTKPVIFHLHPSRGAARGFAEPAFPSGREGEHYISVPLTEGRIAAGMPIITEENVIDHILLHMRVLKQSGASKNLIACRVQGESMLPHLNPGDIVIIDRDVDKERILERKIYAVYEGGGITAKMLQKDGSHLYLIPLNLAEKIQHIDLRENENPIVGLVIGAWRNFEGRVI
ncbi:MAG: LexA family transcriptional regulator [Nitrospinae bacterium]|nr:LexA family transcriptional regulator [Nitrospinota bacterium]